MNRYQDTPDSEEKPLLSSSTHSIPGKYSPLSAFLIFFFPAMGGLLFGYDIGATSAVVTQLESKAYSGVSWYSTIADSSVLQGTITSIGMAGALTGSIICFSVADDLGRRRSLILASTLFALGATVEWLSGTSSWSANAGISVLIIGRFIYGLACGFAMNGAPSYIGEMAPTEIRGLLVSLKEAFIVLGMVLGYSIGWALSEVSGGWRDTYVAAVPMALVMGLGMLYLPYSARWLALKGRISEARRSLKFVTPNLPESEVAAIQEVAEKASQAQAHSSSLSEDWARLTSPTIWPALVAGVGLVFLQQVTGQPSVLYYADSIFQDVGLSTIASIAVSGFKLVATLFATFTVDNYGRKLLLYIGCSLMLVALLVLGTAFVFPYTSASECEAYSTESSCLSSCSWDSACGSNCTSVGYDDGDCTCCGVSGITTQKAVILTALFVYIGGYQVGFGPISWLIISEIFPLEVRGKAVSVAVVTNFFWNTVMSFFFPVELEYIGSAATFYLYAVVLAFGVYFIYSRVPETKGLSLEQIEDFFIRSSALNAQGGGGGGESGGGERDGWRGRDRGRGEEDDKLKLNPVI